MKINQYFTLFFYLQKGFHMIHPPQGILLIPLKIHRLVIVFLVIVAPINGFTIGKVYAPELPRVFD